MKLAIKVAYVTKIPSSWTQGCLIKGVAVVKFKLGWWLVVPVMLVTTAFAGHHLAKDMYWGDEIATLRKMGVSPYPSQNILEVVENVARTRWLPAYDMVLLVWGRLLGWSELGTRSFSLFMGLIAIALIYRLGRYLVNDRMGLVAAILLGTSVVQIYYMHEMRGYSMLITLTISAILLYRYVLDQENLTWRTRLLFIGLFTFLMYTHYFGSVVIASIGLYHLLFQRKSPNWMRIIRSFVVVGGLFLPWLPITALSVYREALHVRGLTPIEIFQDIFNAYGNGLPILLVVLLICAAWTPRKRTLFFLSFCAIAFLLMSFAINLVATSLFHIRHILGLFPFVLLLVALGIQQLLTFNRVIGTSALAILALGGLYASITTEFMGNLHHTHKNVPMTTIEAGVDFATTCGSADDAMVAHFSRNIDAEWEQVSIEYYFHSVTYPFGMLGFLPDLRELDDSRITIVEEEDYPAARDALLQGRSHVWLLTHPKAYQAPSVDALDVYLADEFEYCDTLVESDTLIAYVYAHEPEVTCAAVSEEPISLPACEPGLILSSVSVEP
jgi:hypothetical protein